MILNHKANVQRGGGIFGVWPFEILCQIRIYFGDIPAALCAVLILWPELEFIYLCFAALFVLLC